MEKTQIKNYTNREKMKLRRERETGSVPREEDRHRRLKKRRGVETEEKRKLKGERSRRQE